MGLPADQAKSLRTVGCTLGVILAGGLAVAIVMIGGAVRDARSTSLASLSLTSLRTQARALILYAEASEGRLPLAGAWMDAAGSRARSPSAFQRVSPPAAYGYAFNAALSGRLVAGAAPSTPLTYESQPDERNASGGPDSLLQADKVCLSFVDGRAQRLPRDQAARLPWQP